jgi:drug/metabolite transporter (DMT)-like permease
VNDLVVLAVLGAAVLHAGWNALAKKIPDRLVAANLIGLAYLGAGVVGCVLLPLPDAGSWPFVAASAGVQTAYLLLLTAAYERSDFGQAYALTRGMSIIGITVVSTVLVGEEISAGQLLGVGVIASALLGLTWIGRTRSTRLGIALAGLVALTITTYSLVDGHGVRVSGNALSYAAWLFLLQGVCIPVTCWILAADRRRFVVTSRGHLRIGLFGGLLSLVAYAVVVWAQSVAPLSIVSALRESSVLIAGLLGYLVFGEPLSRGKVALTLLAVAGVVLVKLG